MYISSKYKKLYITIFLLIILITFYVKQFFFSDLEINDLFYLSFGYPSDPIYLPLISRFFDYIQNENLSFPYLYLYAPEGLLYKYFGFNYIWLTLPLYKTIFLIIFFLSINKIYKLKELPFFYVGTILLILTLSNYELFSDRLMRPVFSNIFYFLIIFIFFKICKFNESKNLDFFILGFSSAICLSIVPWDSLFLCPLYLILLKYTSKKKFLIFICTFFIFYFTNLINFYNLFFLETIHIEYLGKKEISDNIVFIRDNLIEIFKSKRILLLFMIILISSIILKNKIYLFILFSSLIFGLGPYLILKTTIQTYHIPWGFFSFLFFFGFFVLMEFYKKFQQIFDKIINSNFKFVKLLIISILVLSFFISTNPILQSGENWIDRSEDIKKKYKPIFDEVRKLNPDIIVVSNDAYLRAYLMLEDKKFMPSEGFFSHEKLENKIAEVKNILVSKNTFSNLKNEICFHFISNTQNLFDSTSVTKSKIVDYPSKNLSNISAVNSWQLIIPEEIEIDIKEYLENFKNEKIKNLKFYDLYQFSESNGQSKCNFNNSLKF